MGDRWCVVFLSLALVGCAGEEQAPVGDGAGAIGTGTVRVLLVGDDVRPNLEQESPEDHPPPATGEDVGDTRIYCPADNTDLDIVPLPPESPGQGGDSEGPIVLLRLNVASVSLESGATSVELLQGDVEAAPYSDRHLLANTVVPAGVYDSLRVHIAPRDGFHPADVAEIDAHTLRGSAHQGADFVDLTESLTANSVYAAFGLRSVDSRALPVGAELRMTDNYDINLVFSSPLHVDDGQDKTVVVRVDALSWNKNLQGDNSWTSPVVHWNRSAYHVNPAFNTHWAAATSQVLPTSFSLDSAAVLPQTPRVD